MIELTSKNVRNIFMDCLFQENEINNGEPTKEAIMVNGVVMNAGLCKERVELHKEEISQLCDQLPDTFKEGMSFLAMCYTKSDVLWGEHKNMEELLLLGLACGKMAMLVPREMWSLLPGGMPYVKTN